MYRAALHRAALPTAHLALVIQHLPRLIQHVSIEAVAVYTMCPQLILDLHAYMPNINESCNQATSPSTNHKIHEHATNDHKVPNY